MRPQECHSKIRLMLFIYLFIYGVFTDTMEVRVDLGLYVMLNGRIIALRKWKGCERKRS
jgi:hypothetical protein